MAKSNANNGFSFTHHESGDEIILHHTKAIKNRYRGLYLYGSYNISITESLLSDNTLYGLDLGWVDNLNIIDTLFSGIASATKRLVNSPYFNKPCISNSYYPPMGLRLPTNIWRWNRKDNIGATLKNVSFTNFDHSDECTPSVPIGFNKGHIRNNHFDFLTMFQNVSFDGNKIMDAPLSDEAGAKDIAIHDIDGSSDPANQSVDNPGMFVSNTNYLKAFAGADSCTRYSNGISYCADSCYRTVTLMVDQNDSNEYDLVISRMSDGVQAVVPFVYEYDDNEHLNHYTDQFRLFSASLPTGSYDIAFMKDLQPRWPTFVLPRWEGVPNCSGYVSANNLTLVEPLSSCDDMILNGDMELGTYHWKHRNSRSDKEYGEILAVEGAGMNRSVAIRYYNRTSNYHGIGQNLDTRCLHQSLNEFYEIHLYFRLENGTTPFICDPFDSDWEVRCPFVIFQQTKTVDEKLESQYIHRRAEVIIPNDLGDFNLIHGVFKVDEILHSLERIFMYVEYVHADFDMIMDNVSVQKMEGVCEGNLLQNGNFEENGKYW